MALEKTRTFIKKTKEGSASVTDLKGLFSPSQLGFSPDSMS